MVDEPTDHDLVVQIRRGDRRAFRALYDRHFDRVCAHAGRTLGPDGDVEAVAQEVFVQVYRSLGSFRAESRFTTWLYTITRRVTMAHLRRNPQTIDLRSLVGATAAQDVHSHAVARAELKRLYAALETLKPEARDAFVLHEIEGKTLAEIARLTSASINTIAARVRRAREQVRYVIKSADRARTSEEVAS